MAERIRFHLDEHIDPEIAGALRRHGVDVTTTLEAGLRSADDLEQLQFARDEGRVVVTDDDDFLRLAASGEEHPGIVVPHRHRLGIGEIVRGLILIYEVLRPDEMRDRVEYLKDRLERAAARVSRNGIGVVRGGDRVAEFPSLYPCVK